MRQCLKKVLAALVLATPALLPGAAVANLHVQELGAALAVPIITGGDTVTATTVTNGYLESITLAIRVISGDPGDGWRSVSFSCHVTGNETTFFLFEPDGAGASKVSFECSATDADENSPPAKLNVKRTEYLAAATGIMFVAIEQNGVSVSRNALFGDSVVIDYVQGMAYGLPAIPFQGIDPFGQDGNRQYRFDNREYAAFPAVLASNFLAPSTNEVTAEVILFALDGVAGQAPVPVDLEVEFYNDDELLRDASVRFDCFTILALEAIDPRFAARYLGSPAGSFVLTPRDVTVGSSPHEGSGTGVDGVRNIPFQGWLVQSVVPGGSIAGPGAPTSNGLAAWAYADAERRHAPSRAMSSTDAR
jgi:hypothetical protein